jgi:hypothetical protein
VATANETAEKWRKNTTAYAMIAKFIAQRMSPRHQKKPRPDQAEQGPKPQQTLIDLRTPLVTAREFKFPPCRPPLPLIY